VHPFTDKQIELVANFAAQAVIAIENTRLLNELRESLQQQTATAEVLKTISGSTGQLEPVFNAMLENAVRICGAKFGSLVLFEGNAYRRAALHNAPAAFVEARARDPVLPLAASPILSRVAGTKQVIQFADIAAEHPEEPIATLGGARTILAAPMLNDDRVVGVISIYRQEVHPFTDKQIELVKNFAAQAVIAIENTRLLNELRQRTDDLSEALEQQTATSEVLKVISSSPGELEPVFNAMLENAVRICEAKFGILFLSEGDAFRTVALHGAPPAYAEARRREPVIRPNPGMASSDVARTKQPVQIADIRAEPAYTGDPQRFAILELAGARTMLNVPMLKEEKLVGQIAIYRQEVRPFTDKQIELVKNFAAQAVIAIENTRLLNELRESLQQQTATADVLKVISRSTFDLQTVLNTLVQSVIQLCDAESAHIFRRTDDTYRVAACGGYSSEYQEYARGIVIMPGRDSLVGRIALENQLVHIPDVLADPEYNPARGQKIGGWRTMLGVPLSREGVPIGAMTVTRSQVRPFTDKQIELLTTFADQAVIAIENTRLLNELRQRTNDLTESLEQQTATSEILEVISNSPTDTQPAFDAIVHSGLNLFPDAVVAISLPDRDLVKLAAIGGADEAGLEALRGRYPMPLSHEFITGTAILDRREIDLADAREPPRELTVGAQNLLAGGYRARR
jgi:two-component system, NtrC family, sensor kinase